MAKKTTKKPKSPEVELDRRSSSDRRSTTNSTEVPFKSERRKVSRRRQIDPTTCERDYTNDEIEFMQAMDAYKRSSGRQFPTCSEILEVVRSLGYLRPHHEVASVEVVPTPADFTEDWDSDEPEFAVAESE